MVLATGITAIAIAWTWVSTVRLPHGSGATNMYYPSISADGSKVACVADDGNIWLEQWNGTSWTASRVNSSRFTLCSRPHISRDGTAIAYFGKDSETDDHPFVPVCYNLATTNEDVMAEIDGSPGVSTVTGFDADRLYPPGISDDQGDENHSHWLCYRDLRTAVIHGESVYNPLIKWNAGNTVDAATYDLGVAAFEPDLDSAPSHLAYVADPNGTHPQVFRIGCWSTSGSELVSHSTSGTTSEGNNQSSDPSIDGGGTHIAFDSMATNLTSSSHNTEDIYYADRDSTWSVTIAYSLSGSSDYDFSFSPHISANGSYIAFESQAGNLVTTHAVTWTEGLALGFTSSYLVQRGSPTTLDLVSYKTQEIPEDGSLIGCRGESAVCSDNRDVALDSPDAILLWFWPETASNSIYYFRHP